MLFKKLQLDPRTTLLTVIVLNVAMFSAGFSGGAGLARLVLMTVPALLALGAGHWWSALSYSLLVGTAYLVESHLIATGSSGVGLAVAGLASLVARLAPGLFMAYVAVITIRVGELLAALEASRVPRWLAIPAAVVLRFLPTVWEQSKGVQRAMNVRGLNLFRVGLGPWLEYRLVPLITSTVRCGEELSQAALTRGLGRPGRVQRIAQIGWGPADVVIWMVLAAGIGVWVAG
ncbi:MAG: energy-coupling factor transporter transmembrane protein EcfT [Bifidobacteriaceae bacterium]|jgi:energy-coupling factor transport system permease protein|nr:energy-coupling factor transporter transmembrane protein EcfT [Bifidobacteriaceae bacterium]